MRKKSASKFLEQLRVLVCHEVEFIVAALKEINALYDDPAGRRIVPDAAKLATIKVHLLLTDLGGLDILRSIADQQTYEDLLARSSEYEVEGMRLRVLNLETVIESKEFARDDRVGRHSGRGP